MTSFRQEGFLASNSVSAKRRGILVVGLFACMFALGYILKIFIPFSPFASTAALAFMFLALISTIIAISMTWQTPIFYFWFKSGEVTFLENGFLEITSPQGRVTLPPSSIAGVHIERPYIYIVTNDKIYDLPNMQNEEDLWRLLVQRFREIRKPFRHFLKHLAVVLSLASLVMFYALGPYIKSNAVEKVREAYQVLDLNAPALIKGILPPDETQVRARELFVEAKNIAMTKETAAAVVAGLACLEAIYEKVPLPRCTDALLLSHARRIRL